MAGREVAVLLLSTGDTVTDVVLNGPLLVAAAVALAAGALSFVSPCCLPLVPAYLSYVTGASGQSSQQPTTSSSPGGRPDAGVLTRAPVIAGTVLFVLGFAAVFTSYGAAFGGVGTLLLQHQEAVTRVLGVVTIMLGLLFAGVLARLPLATRTVGPAWRPKAGLAGAPLLGVVFGVGWTPCIGPTLAAVLALATSTGGAQRGAVLAFVYSVGLGVPFIALAAGFAGAVRVVDVVRRHVTLISRLGGFLLVGLGLLQLSGAWTMLMTKLQSVVAAYTLPL